MPGVAGPGHAFDLQFVSGKSSLTLLGILYIGAAGST